MNFSRSFALKGACAAAMSALLVACGDNNGEKELAAGLEALSAHELKKAERLFTECLEQDSGKVDAYVGLARVQLELGELPAAREAVDAAAKLEPNAVDVIELGAQVAFHQKDYAVAQQGFRALAGNASLDGTVRAKGWTGLGIVEMAQNNFDLARVDFLQALLVDRRNAPARYHLALIYRDSFDYAEAALEQFEFYVRLGQQASPRVQEVQRVHIPALKESIARSLRELPSAANRNSTASAAALQRAQAAEKRGRNDMALQEYRLALKSDPLSYPAALGMAKCLMKTTPSRKRGGISDPQGEALKAYRIACKLRPSAISTYLTTGELAAKRGQHATAVMLYSRTLAADPTNLSALDGLIRALQRVGSPKEVTKAYQSYRDTLATRKGK